MATTEQVPVDESLRPVLEQVRKDLLDFGMRNPLLNYRLLKSKGVESITVDPAPMFEFLVTEGQELRFTPAQVITATVGKAVPGESRISAQTVNSNRTSSSGEHESSLTLERFSETYFIADHNQQDLDKRLLATYYAARTSIEEQGVNTLFMAIGMLHWKDPSAPEDAHQAPLILIPVELERESASEGFRLRYTNDDVSPNVCLIEFLKQFNVKIDLPAEDEEFDLRRYFQRFSDAISIESDWSIDTEAVVLGFFSFSKFLMYRDLDPTIWPTSSGLLSHDVLQNLLGSNSFSGDPSLLSDNDFLDDLPNAAEVVHVMDADSTQTLVLLDADSGRSMVVQGPPGTGKSQTIVNLIAGAIEKGKTVLFVSEKKAALEVVKKRLDKCGLGNACLELHSNKAKKKELIAELKRMVDLGLSHSLPKTSARLALEEAKAKLNQYCQAINSEVGPSRERTRDLFGLLLPVLDHLKGIDIPTIKLPEVLVWTDRETEQKRLLVQKLQDALTRVGVPEQHPFWGSQLRVLLPATQERARQALLHAAALANQCRECLRKLAALLGADMPQSPNDGQILRDIAKRLLAAPNLFGLDLENPAWCSQATTIDEVIEAGHKLAEIRSAWSGKLTDEAWTTDVSALHSDLMRLQKLWWRAVLPEWYSVKHKFAGLFIDRLPKQLHQMIEVTCAIRDAEMLRQKIRSNSEIAAELFRSYWLNEQSDWQTLRAQFDWIKRLLNPAAEPAAPLWGLRFIGNRSDRSLLKDTVAEAERLCDELKAKRTVVLELLKCGEEIGIAAKTAPSQSFNSIEAVLAECSERLASLSSLAHYMQVRDECLNAKLKPVAELADNWEHGLQSLVDVFQYWRLSLLIDRAFEKNPVLSSFDQTSHTTSAETFRQLDAESLSWARDSIAKRHCGSIPTAATANGQLGYLRMMFERRSRFPAIRKLIENAGHAIQAFKPVFMMSPLSIANFIPPDSIRFDLVVFDEASQVRPADALGAIARGKQAIVVGDSKQLPPTSFFDSLTGGEDDDDAADSPATDIESILGLFCSRSAHQRMLRWHYRSRHESLISGSNHLFYDDRLVVFPSPEKRRNDLGLMYHKLTDAPYDRSRTRTNPVEARAVAEAVMKFAAEQLTVNSEARMTLGVATFSVAQRDAVLDQLEILRRTQPGLEGFFSGPPHEPFFVKNLENVQGDERDAIFISVGYGRTKDGYLSMGFGPVNRNGGERRLNVLFTRARRRCEVFTTLCSDDIDIGQNPSEGLQAFKMFLQFAERGYLELPTSTGKAPDSPFEEEVLSSLQRLGYTVETQVGCAGFFIDMAVLDKNAPGRYVIGIECDGATYHSARSARDRDRLRQAVLEGLGWRLYRIWSTAWFHDRGREIERLVAAICSGSRCLGSAQAHSSGFPRKA